MEKVEAHAAHGGGQEVWRHRSTATGTDMTFAVFLPPQAADGRCPVLYYLSGLTCTHANVMEKGEYRRAAAEHGLVVVCPDVSPRGEGVANDESYDLGQGAGFYLDATREPWSRHYRMESYVLDELPRLIGERFPVDGGRQSVFGHSMGGHGALTLALKNPGRFRSCSAFSPIVAPSQVPWGEKAFTAYLGDERSAWRRHDAIALIEDGARVGELLVDQGEADNFLKEQLRPHLLREACEPAGIDLTLRMHSGYDHSYYFISTFMADHIAWHAERLRG
ncbi:MAG TPA: S-formylglutathione hydrolase [Afifellaceae bacterium]|nr:S-formylglutathione hydrolase [Afifellaceae bacterium]